jgi:hypothetical protein
MEATMPKYEIKTLYTVESYEIVEADSPETALEQQYGHGLRLCGYCSGTMQEGWGAEENSDNPLSVTISTVDESNDPQEVVHQVVWATIEEKDPC